MADRISMAVQVLDTTMAQAARRDGLFTKAEVMDMLLDARNSITTIHDVVEIEERLVAARGA